MAASSPQRAPERRRSQARWQGHLPTAGAIISKPVTGITAPGSAGRQIAARGRSSKENPHAAHVLGQDRLSGARPCGRTVRPGRRLPAAARPAHGRDSRAARRGVEGDRCRDHHRRHDHPDHHDQATRPQLGRRLPDHHQDRQLRNGDDLAAGAAARGRSPALRDPERRHRPGAPARHGRPGRLRARRRPRRHQADGVPGGDAPRPWRCDRSAVRGALGRKIVQAENRAGGGRAADHARAPDRPRGGVGPCWPSRASGT